MLRKKVLYLVSMKAKKPSRKTGKLPKKLSLPNDEPLHIDMSFEDIIKKAVNTPIKNSKINKK